MGSVLGKAKYSDYLFVYQGITIGGNRNGKELFHPTIGNNVVLYANATVLGKTVLGDNAIIAVNSYLINENIPSNSIWKKSRYCDTEENRRNKRNDKTYLEMGLGRLIWKSIKLHMQLVQEQIME